MYEKFIKRAIGIALSSAGIVLTAVPMLAVAVIIKIDSPGPVFFRQKRVGKDKKLFTILKFRSMPVTVPKDTPTHQFKAEDQLSAWQKFMRKSSIDELPQFFCIWIGTVSIVGPRPALWNQDDLIAERDKYHANDVKPGLTGLAQISGRDELEIPVKAQFDGEYVRRRGLFYDLGLMFRTVFSVFRHEGGVEGGTGEMHKEEKNDRT